MKTEIQKLILLKKFFKNVQIVQSQTIVDLEIPSRILVKNIHHSWLKSIYGKTVQHFPVFLNKQLAQKCNKSYYGFIDNHSCDIKKIVFNQNSEDCHVQNNVQLKLNLIVPQPDVMQYYVQWQRYRKYWWSSVTTTPSLISINDMKHKDDGSDVNIISNFKYGQQALETISVNAQCPDTLGISINKNTSCLTCTMGLETALVSLLLDGLSNATKEEYLRLHNVMAPYKISFALDSEGTHTDPKVLSTLKDLAKLLNYKLKLKEISTWLPSFTLPIQSQVKENLHLGVTYTAILNESTLSNGIFHLLNSNTMLREQVHVADFDSYAALLCKK